MDHWEPLTSHSQFALNPQGLKDFLVLCPLKKLQGIRRSLASVAFICEQAHKLH